MDPALGESALSLPRHGVRAKKSMGQNFLVDGVVARAILEALPADPRTVVEVGAGPGTMTRALAGSRDLVVAIELDPRLAAVLRRGCRDLTNLSIVEGDVLQIDVGALLPAPYAVFGNIPYNITGLLLPKLLTLDPLPEWVSVVVQLQVAQRLCADPGAWSLSTLGVRALARAEMIMPVPARAFEPRPKVDSALIRLWPHPRAPFADDSFFDFARAVFQERRKTLPNAVANALGHDVARGRRVVARSGLDQMRRPQTLDLGEWEALYAAFREIGR